MRVSVKYVEGRTDRRDQADTAPPGNETLDRRTERRGIASVFHDRDGCRRNPADLYVAGLIEGGHETVPRYVQWLERRTPALPVGSLAETRWLLSHALSKYTGKGIRCGVTSVHGDIRDRFTFAKCQLVGGAFHAGELDIAIQGQIERRHELPVKMVFRKSRNATQRIQVQAVIKMQVNVIEHLLHPGLVALVCVGHGFLPLRTPA
ncbi:hypothetical protein THH46_13465 [Pseudomonas sp. NA13]